MKKLIFHFDQPKSTIILLEKNSAIYSKFEIDNDLLFIEPSNFPKRLIEIAFNNYKAEKLERLIFVFDGDLDKVNGVILFNEALNYISYKETYNLYDLKSKFSPYLEDTNNIKLLSHLDFYSSLVDEKNTQYLSLLIYLGNSISVELAYDKVIRTSLNADIKLIPIGNKFYKASKLLSNNYLIKNSDDDITVSYTNNMVEVILFFMSVVQERNLTVNSIQIISNKSELIRENILIDRLKTKFSIYSEKSLLSNLDVVLTRNNFQFITMQDMINDPVKNLPIVIGFLLAPLIPLANNLIQKMKKKNNIDEKIDDLVNKIVKIMIKAVDGEPIGEFTSISELEEYIREYSDILDPLSKVEIIDSNKRVISYTLAELKNISNFSTVEMKIKSSFHPLIGEVINRKLLT